MTAPRVTEFLLARIAVAEEIADDRHIWNCPASPDYKGSTSGGRCECAQRHILNDLRAKRTIVTEARDYSPELSDGDNGEWAFDLVLRQFATVYADHPDYDEAWRP